MDGRMMWEVEEETLTFKASNQTAEDGVNKEVSDKHTLFTLLLALTRGGGGWREVEGGGGGDGVGV